MDKVKSNFDYGQSTKFERLLLFILVALLPFEYNFTSLYSRGVIFIFILLIGIYIFIFRPYRFITLAKSLFVKIGIVFLVLSSMIEFFHPMANYYEIAQIGSMIVGSLIIGALISDKKALSTVIYSFMFIGVIVSLLLLLYSYHDLRSASASNFWEASLLRNETLSDLPLSDNINRLSFFIGQTTILAFIYAIFSKKNKDKIIYYLILSLATVGLFLGLSRSGISIFAVTLVIFYFIYKLNIKKIIPIIIITVSMVVWFVPNSVFSRYHFVVTDSDPAGNPDTRLIIYRANISNFPEYALFGVGAGNFWQNWGLHKEYENNYSVIGSHNIITQIWIYWGVVGAVILIIWMVNWIKMLPPKNINDIDSMAIFVILVGLINWLMLTHNLYNKEVTISLGTLIGTHYFIYRQNKLLI